MDSSRASSRPRQESQKKKDGDVKPPSKEPSKPEATGPIRWQQDNIKEADFTTPATPQLGAPIQIRGIDFYQPDHATNQSSKSLRYPYAVADPRFPYSQFYRQTEVAPFGPGLNFSDRSQSSLIDATGRIFTVPKGFVSAKGITCVREGKFYCEIKVLVGIPSKANSITPGYTPHVRMGFGRREASLEVPVGSNPYSYGLRDAEGKAMFRSREDGFQMSEDIKEGDVIGLEICLPSLKLHRKIIEGTYNPAVDFADDDMNGSAEAVDIVRDRFARRLPKGQLVMEVIDYSPDNELFSKFHQPGNSTVAAADRGDAGKLPGPNHPIVAFRTLPNSYIKVYKNGVDKGVAFKDLLAFLPPASHPELPSQYARLGKDDGMLGYFPQVSAIGGGSVEINCGPDFTYPPPGYLGEDEVDMVGVEKLGVSKEKIHPLSERYDEQIAEDIVYDLVDEVDYMMQGLPMASASAGGAGRAREE